MAETVIMPKLGFDMAEGTLLRWVVQEGEEIEKGAILAEIETDKATVEVESNYSGTVARHLIPAGEIVPIGTPIAIIAAPGEDVAKAVEAAQTSVKQKTDDQGESEIDETTRGVKEKKVAKAAESEVGSLPDDIRASPLARRMANDMGVSLSKIQGSGVDGRIVAKDIEAYLAKPSKEDRDLPRPSGEDTPHSQEAISTRSIEKPSSIPQALPVLSPLPSAETPADKMIKLSRLRAAIGRRMLEAKQQVPHFYVTHSYDLDNLLTLRKQLNQMLPDDQKISVNDFIVKAVALALRQFPNLNASLNKDHVIQHGSINIGVAVAVEGGLLTVVCRNADRKNLREIAREVRTMAGRARDGKVRPDDIEGSTFSVSNLGMYDVEEFSAIINPPEAAILAVSSAKQIPIVKDGQVVISWQMNATISVDHRISDGAEAARFLQALAPYLEQPLLLLV
jgi:pyruvate dehydrogenase E2 component (dihydrolipoamide acetyltransferase)